MRSGNLLAYLSLNLFSNSHSWWDLLQIQSYISTRGPGTFNEEYDIKISGLENSKNRLKKSAEAAAVAAEAGEAAGEGKKGLRRLNAKVKQKSKLDGG